ncbi:penicillin-binding transpeptidase domain-containing protein [Streptomyces solicathayae]|uniref:Penicillin-binding transpeptidase domain-containing protein n=1 Tax=Streptomyces solicathayae TaxID=3081768 RepID=A0ABZ0LWW1_9ACTN|nr:penicillin-binding transpeptidase domain-containing protein [Streptomyces sp. HUAS YS2]WOX23911.1 penicillin-binding transpeptidase domain-containing protein [Streptomyces sp. HUAS YS2]
MRGGVKVAIVGGVFVVVAGGVGYGGYNLWQGISGGAGVGPMSDSARNPTGPVRPEEVEETSKKFLAAWAAGSSDEAAQLTNNPVDAGPVIAGYAAGAGVSKAVITAGTPDGTKVPFTVNATVTYEGTSKPWTYTSELTVVRGASTGRPLVDWKPSVVHPRLTKTTTLRTGAAKTAAIKAVDHKGRELTKEKYPSLGPVLDELRKKYGARTGGKAGIETVLESSDANVPDSTLFTLVKGEPGTLETTIDADVQAAAERAVKQYGQASVVAVKPSTGEVRAVANSPAAGFNSAFLGKQAPGSTLKIATAALLLEKGLVGADRVAECPRNVMYQGRSFHNLKNFELNGKSFGESFARSCNTAFIKLIDDTKDDAALGKVARDVFGIGLDWQTGIPSFDGSIPEATGGEAAAQYIGQGTVQMNVLNIASITATAKHGTFKQPILVAKDLDDRPIAKAARSLPDSVAQQLRAMMRRTAVSGTAANAMLSVRGDKGAKTGSAEVDDQATSNSWFTGYAGDLAAAAVVQSGGHGGDAAGPVVAKVLNAR